MVINAFKYLSEEGRKKLTKLKSCSSSAVAQNNVEQFILKQKKTSTRCISQILLLNASPQNNKYFWPNFVPFLTISLQFWIISVFVSVTFFVSGGRVGVYYFYLGILYTHTITLLTALSLFEHIETCRSQTNRPTDIKIFGIAEKSERASKYFSPTSWIFT